MALIGGTTVLLPSGGFSSAATLELMETERITSVFLVPAQWQLLCDDATLASHDLSALKTILWGAAPATTTLPTRMAEAFPGVTNVAVFGQTEMSPVTCALSGEDALRKIGSVGKPVSIRMAEPVAPLGALRTTVATPSLAARLVTLSLAGQAATLSLAGQTGAARLDAPPVPLTSCARMLTYRHNDLEFIVKNFGFSPWANNIDVTSLLLQRHRCDIAAVSGRTLAPIRAREVRATGRVRLTGHPVRAQNSAEVIPLAASLGRRIWRALESTSSRGRCTSSGGSASKPPPKSQQTLARSMVGLAS